MKNDIGFLSSLSIIVPAYKAESFIVPSLVEIEKVVREYAKSYEIICVVDGKVDKTYDLANNLAKKSGKIKVLGYQKNRGKGHAVRFGMAKARGEIVGFIDAGLEIDPSSLRELIKVQKNEDADIVVGSKRHPKSRVTYPTIRKIISIFYYYLVKILFNLEISDTQAGVKIFKKKVIETVFPKLRIDGFAFDIEILTLSKLSGFGKIFEAPIYVRMVKTEKSSTLDSMTKVLMASMRMFYDTIYLYLRLKL